MIDRCLSSLKRLHTSLREQPIALGRQALLIGRVLAPHVGAVDVAAAYARAQSHEARDDRLAFTAMDERAEVIAGLAIEYPPEFMPDALAFFGHKAESHQIPAGFREAWSMNSIRTYARVPLLVRS